MGVKQVKVNVNELAIGMFVSGLDRPWSQTPFPLQGFYIRDVDDIAQLRSHCKHVFLDVSKAGGSAAAKLKTLTKGPSSSVSSAKVRLDKSTVSTIPVAPLKIRRNTYSAEMPLKKEVKQAQQLHRNVFKAIGDVFGQVSAGSDVPMQAAKRSASEMVDSVIRNPDAFSWLARVREKDEYTYSHAMRSSVWAILLGRHLGLTKQQLDTLSLGVLLKDVGKVKMDQDLLVNTHRTAKEEVDYEKFVSRGVEILRATPNVDPKVISVVKTHCERLNGSGFPQHLIGDKIPLLGKIAGIVTFYDITTNPRGEIYPLAPSKAVAQLYELRNIEFQEELVVEFIRAIGLYPTGTLVELNTGEVAVVVEQNFERRLKPKVLVVLDAFKKPMSDHLLLDLAEDDRRKQVLIDSGERRLDEVEKIEIAQDLEPGSYEVDISDIRDKYLFQPDQQEKKKGFFSFLKK